MKYLNLWIVAISTIMISLTSCAPKATKIVPPEFKAGQNQFHRVCANCHGADALGKNTKAPGLIDPEYLSENFSDDEIYKQVIEGSDKMPSQRNKISDSEITEIIKYLRYSQKEADLAIEEDELDESDE